MEINERLDLYALQLDLITVLARLMPVVESAMGPHEKNQPGVRCYHCEAVELLDRIKAGGGFRV